MELREVMELRLVPEARVPMLVSTEATPITQAGRF